MNHEKLNKTIDEAREKMTLPSSTECINSLIRSHYNRLDETNTVAILVHQLADRTYKDIDPDKKSPLLVECAALLELRQLARAICRARQVQGEHESESGCLFDFTLQPRYPARRDGVEAYVLREHLTLAERRDNITRLRHESAAKIQHADALEAETERLILQGVLVAEVSLA